MLKLNLSWSASPDTTEHPREVKSNMTVVMPDMCCFLRPGKMKKATNMNVKLVPLTADDREQFILDNPSLGDCSGNLQLK